MEHFMILMNQKIKRYKDNMAARAGRNNGEGDTENPDVD